MGSYKNRVSRSPLKAIRKNCLDCSGNSSKEVELCVIPECPLYPFRFGISPDTAAKKGKDIEQKKGVKK